MELANTNAQKIAAAATPSDTQQLIAAVAAATAPKPSSDNSALTQILNLLKQQQLGCLTEGQKNHHPRIPERGTKTEKRFKGYDGVCFSPSRPSRGPAVPLLAAAPQAAVLADGAGAAHGACDDMGPQRASRARRTRRCRATADCRRARPRQSAVQSTMSETPPRLQGQCRPYYCSVLGLT